MKERIKDHLRKRGIDLERTNVTIDEQAGNATFYIYNLSGQLIGFQQYTPTAEKSRGKNAKDLHRTAHDDVNARNQLRYFTAIGYEGDVKKLAVWGLETLMAASYIFITEGIFDAIKIHNAGHPAIAVLTNRPKRLRSWLKALGKTVIAVLDNDDAGSALSNIADKSIVIPDQYKDLGEMSQDEVNIFIVTAMKQRHE